MERHAARVKARLSRMGMDATIERQGPGTENRFGKMEYEWSPVTTESVVLDLRNGGAARQMDMSGGEFDQHTPVLTFAHDSVVEDGDRVTVGGVKYEVRTLVPYPTHKVASVVSVNGEL